MGFGYQKKEFASVEPDLFQDDERTSNSVDVDLTVEQVRDYFDIKE